MMFTLFFIVFKANKIKNPTKIYLFKTAIEILEKGA